MSYIRRVFAALTVIVSLLFFRRTRVSKPCLHYG